MTAITVVGLMFGFIVKHFVCDFMMQWKYQYSNKGQLGHPGGILHALICAIGTIVVLFSLDISVHLMLGLALLDGVIHYFIDYGKVNINKYYGWTAITHEQFWVLVGFDQFLHYTTYLIIILLLI
jgi:hypothetical protein